MHFVAAVSSEPLWRRVRHCIEACAGLSPATFPDTPVIVIAPNDTDSTTRATITANEASQSSVFDESDPKSPYMLASSGMPEAQLSPPQQHHRSMAETLQQPRIPHQSSHQAPQCRHHPGQCERCGTDGFHQGRTVSLAGDYMEDSQYSHTLGLQIRCYCTVMENHSSRSSSPAVFPDSP